MRYTLFSWSPCPKRRPKALNGAAITLTILLPPFFGCTPTSAPESSSTIASGSPSRWIVAALHIAVAAKVKTKAIKMAMILRLFIGPAPLHIAENVNEVEGSGAKDGDKERREQETGQREQQFHRGFLCFLFGSLPSFRAQRIGEDTQSFGYRSTKLIRLNQHRDETAQIINASSFCQVAQGFV